MNRSDHSENELVSVITEKILIIPIVGCFPIFTESVSVFSEERRNDDFTDSISGSHKKNIQSRSVFTEESAKLFRNGKDNMSVRSVETHGFSFGGKNLLLFNTAGSAETGVTMAGDQIDVFAFGTFKDVVSEMASAAKKSLLNVVNNAGSAFIIFFPAEEATRSYTRGYP